MTREFDNNEGSGFQIKKSGTTDNLRLLGDGRLYCKKGENYDRKETLLYYNTDLLPQR